LLGLGLGANPTSGGRNLTDDELVHAVERSATEHISPGDADARVGEPPWVNSATGGHPKLYLRNVVTDEQASERLPREIGKARAVAFWKRPLAAPNPRIVGLYWMSDGRVVRFFGVVLPH
jgi:hypothetical protein